VRRVLLVRLAGAGGIELLTPAVRSLHHVHPNAELELLTWTESAGFALGLEVFDRVLTVDSEPAGWLASLRRLWGLRARLIARRFDVAYDFERGSGLSEAATLFSGAPVTVGFERRAGRPSAHSRSASWKDDWHIARNLRGLVGGEDGREIRCGDIAPFAVSRAHRADVAAALFAVGFADRGPLVVVQPVRQPGCGEIPPELYAALARTLMDRHQARIALVGGFQESPACSAIARSAACERRSTRVASLAGRLSIGALCALLEDCAAFITCDSDPMHVAAALGAPTIVLTCGSIDAGAAPLGPRVRQMVLPPSASPHDPQGVHDVVAMVREELRRGRRRKTMRELASG
jgi:ADP-heptose:LPS heptosyltransferase